MVKKGQEQVSKADSLRQSKRVDHDEGTRTYQSDAPSQSRGVQQHSGSDGWSSSDDQDRDSFARDLNPDPMAGQNHGLDRGGELGPSAYDIKDVHRTWSGLSSADLKQIPVLPEGTRLEQGATYFDMNDPARGEISAMGYMEAGPRNRYVAKSAVEYQLWNALIGVQNPERLGVADDA